MSSRELFRANHWLALHENDSNGVFVHSKNGVMCVPVTNDGEVIFILEPSNYDGSPMMMLPAGSIDLPETPETTANRELQEEIGYRSNRLNFLGRVRPWCKYLDATIDLYLAQNLETSWLPGDEPYVIEQMKYPLSDIDVLIQNGKLQDSSVITALFLARSWLL